MVSILTRIFGLENLELVEDAVQDTFAQAVQKWKTNIPENPEAWLTKAAKNRVIDIIRKLNADQRRAEKLDYGPSVIAIDQLFAKEEIEDSELRMIFTACHPELDPRDQISFALKTISGFSQNEIAASLLLKTETVKKRLTRARKTINQKKIAFKLPQGKELNQRLDSVCKVLYLIFNEGFHSNHKKLLVRKDLCGEALRLTKILLSKQEFRMGKSYALFGLLCLHASRIESKVDENFESIGLEQQDRSMWYAPLIELGKNAMYKSSEYDDYSIYHVEAAIALEHIKSPSFEETNWEQVLTYYEQLREVQSNPVTELSIATVKLHLNRFNEVEEMLNEMQETDLDQKTYLFFGVLSKLHERRGDLKKAVSCLDNAIKHTKNAVERAYLEKKRARLLNIQGRG